MTRFAPSRYITIDRQALELASLFAVVLTVTAFIALQLGDQAAAISPPEAFGEGAQGEAAAGAAWAIAEVLFAISVLGLIFVYRRLPEWVQDTVKINAVAALALYAGARYGAQGLLVEGIALLVGFFTAYRVLDHYGLYWTLNNVLVVVIAIFAGLAIGLLFGVVGMALAMVGLTIYDHVFANKRGWMFALGEGIVKARLPVIFLRPSGLRLEWEEVVEMMSGAEDGDEEEDEERDTESWGLGTADLMIPAGFVAAVATEPANAVAVGGTLAVVLVCAGILVACFRLRFEMLSRGSGAGLPALCAGALVPYVVLVAVGVAV